MVDSPRDVGCTLSFDVEEPTLLVLQLAPATTAGALLDERLDLTVDGGTPLRPIAELATTHGGRLHLVEIPVGGFRVEHVARVATATLDGPPTPASAGANLSATKIAAPGIEAIVGLRQSRYCPSDELAGFAAREFRSVVGAPPGEIARAVASWVFEEISYSPGSSGPLDSALDTLHSGAGVCRDFAHLAITLCRALGVPSRLAAVYAPGLAPMDFHAVVEVLGPAGWEVVDPTRLAPRTTLVRIATGRDAVDTAFATTLRGSVELLESEIFASTEGVLPADDHTGRVVLP